MACDRDGQIDRFLHQFNHGKTIFGPNYGGELTMRLNNLFPEVESRASFLTLHQQKQVTPHFNNFRKSVSTSEKSVLQVVYVVI